MRASTNDVILVDAVRDTSIPDGHPSDLVRTAVSFHDEKIAALQPKSLELSRKELHSMNIVKDKPASPNVRDTKKGIVVLHGCTRRLLLNPALNVSHLA